jgi:hypothetical protein
MTSRCMLLKKLSKVLRSDRRNAVRLSENKPHCKYSTARQHSRAWTRGLEFGYRHHLRILQRRTSIVSPWPTGAVVSEQGNPRKMCALMTCERMEATEPTMCALRSPKCTRAGDCSSPHVHSHAVTTGCEDERVCVHL